MKLGIITSLVLSSAFLQVASAQEGFKFHRCEKGFSVEDPNKPFTALAPGQYRPQIYTPKMVTGPACEFTTAVRITQSEKDGQVFWQIANQGSIIAHEDVRPTNHFEAAYPGSAPLIYHPDNQTGGSLDGSNEIFRHTNFSQFSASFVIPQGITSEQELICVTFTSPGTDGVYKMGVLNESTMNYDYAGFVTPNLQVGYNIGSQTGSLLGSFDWNLISSEESAPSRLGQIRVDSNFDCNGYPIGTNIGPSDDGNNSNQDVIDALNAQLSQMLNDLVEMKAEYAQATQKEALMVQQLEMYEAAFNQLINDYFAALTAEQRSKILEELLTIFQLKNQAKQDLEAAKQANQALHDQISTLEEQIDELKEQIKELEEN